MFGICKIIKQNNIRKTSIKRYKLLMSMYGDSTSLKEQIKNIVEEHTREKAYYLSVNDGSKMPPEFYWYKAWEHLNLNAKLMGYRNYYQNIFHFMLFTN